MDKLYVNFKDLATQAMWPMWPMWPYVALCGFQKEKGRKYSWMYAICRARETVEIQC